MHAIYRASTAAEKKRRLLVIYEVPACIKCQNLEVVACWLRLAANIVALVCCILYGGSFVEKFHI